MAQVTPSGRLYIIGICFDGHYFILFRTLRLVDNPFRLDWNGHDWIRREKVSDASYVYEGQRCRTVTEVEPTV